MSNHQLPGATGVTRGTIDAVICPHCGKPNDFRMLDEQQLLDTGHVMDCDHCGQFMQVQRIAMLKVISVRQTAPPPRRAPGQAPHPQLRVRNQQQLGQQQAQPRRGIGAAINRLLGGPKK